VGHYPFTLFNGITVLVLVVAILILWVHLRDAFAANWPLVGYAVILGYAIGFPGGLNLFWVAAGVVCGLAIRLGFYAPYMRYPEGVVLGYVICRCVGLVLML
jgi:hypothetical protein